MISMSVLLCLIPAVFLIITCAAFITAICFVISGLVPIFGAVLALGGLASFILVILAQAPALIAGISMVITSLVGLLGSGAVLPAAAAVVSDVLEFAAGLVTETGAAALTTIGAGLCIIGPILICCGIIGLFINLLISVAIAGFCAVYASLLFFITGPLACCFIYPMMVILSIILTIVFGTSCLLLEEVGASAALTLGLLQAQMFEVCAIMLIFVIIFEICLAAMTTIITLTCTSGACVMCTFGAFTVTWVITFIYAVVAIPMSMCVCAYPCLIVVTVEYITCLVCTFTVFPCVSIPFCLASLCVSLSFAGICVPALVIIIACFGTICAAAVFTVLFMVVVICITVVGLSLFTMVEVAAFIVAAIVILLILLCGIPLSCIGSCAYTTLMIGLILVELPLWLCAIMLTVLLLIALTTATGLPIFDWFTSGIQTIFSCFSSIIPCREDEVPAEIPAEVPSEELVRATVIPGIKTEYLIMFLALALVIVLAAVV